VATDKWQQFYKHWRDSSTSSKLLNAFPYMLELGVDPEGKPLLSFRIGNTSGNQILVTKSCFIAYCISASMIWEMKEEQCSLGSPASVGLYGQIPTPCDNSPAHPFSRKNYLPEVHARAADFNRPGRSPV